MDLSTSLSGGFLLVLGVVLLATADGAGTVTSSLTSILLPWVGSGSAVTPSSWSSSRGRPPHRSPRPSAVAAMFVVHGWVLASILQLSMWVLDVVRRLADAERAEEVRTIAQNSLQQIRDVVRGYRALDLATEFEGSVALLRSAGVECTVEHTESDLPVEVRSAAAWVIRERLSNVVRHSAATWCRITVSRSADELGVLLENDGVSSAATGNGSGLAGLAERLHPLGGRLDVRRGDGTFVLDARLEVPA